MSDRLQVNERLQAAVHSTPVPFYLEARIRALLLHPPPRRSWGFWMAPGALAAAGLAGVFLAYDHGHLRFTDGSRASYIASVGNQVPPLMRAGLGDHIHCSLFQNGPQGPSKLDELIKTIGPAYSGLIPIVRQHVPERFEMRTAHRCRYHDRDFVHILMMNGSRLLSLVATRKNSGESFGASGLLPALVQSGIPVYQSGVQRFAIASFETPRFLVYFISDLPPEENSALMLAMTAEVRDFLNQPQS